jgi:hypothetical protein
VPATAVNIVSEAWLQARQTLENTWVDVADPVIPAAAYPVPVRWDGLAVVEDGHPANLMEHVRAALRYLYGSGAEEAEKDLAALLNVEDLADYLNQPNKFFAAHLAQYSQNKRVAPHLLAAVGALGPLHGLGVLPPAQ